MVKKISAMVIAMFMLFSFAACSEVVGNKEVDLQVVKNDILTQTGVTEPIDISTEQFYSLFGIEAEKIKISASYMVSAEIFPDEIMMVEATDEAAAKEIAEKLQIHLEDLKSQASGYDEKGYAIAEATEIHVNGNYVAMFFSQDREQIETIYNGYFE